MDPLAHTSLAALVFEGSNVAVANIGDSRAYIVRSGRFAMLEAETTVHGIATSQPASIAAFVREPSP